MELILHLGAHRTGTTALQHVLRTNRKSLDRRGIGYWGPGILRKVIGAGLLQGAERQDMRGAVAADPSKARDDLGERAGAARERGIARIVVSEENLIGTMPSNLGWAQLYPHTGARLAVLARLLPQAPAAIYLSIRDYAGYWASAYAFSALRRRLPDFADIAPDILRGPRGWPEVAADIAAAFPGAALKLWPYSAGRDGLGRFLRLITGLDDIAVAAEQVRRNLSISGPEVTRAQSLLRDEPGLGAAQLSQKLAQEFPKGGPAFMPFSRAERSELNARWNRDLKRLATGQVAGAELIGAVP